MRSPPRTVLTSLSSQTLNRPSVYTLLLRFLSTVAEHSPVLGFALLEMDVVDTLFLVLTGTQAPDTFAEGAKVPNVGSRSKDQVLEILGTISELLPPLPQGKLLKARTLLVKKDMVINVARNLFL